MGSAPLWVPQQSRPLEIAHLCAKPEHDARHARAVSKSLHVRLDDVSSAALDIVRAGALTDSEAVRLALREAAARRTARSTIRAEVAADEGDREEMGLISEQLAELAPGE
jgi:hypothetical protein